LPASAQDAEHRAARIGLRLPLKNLILELKDVAKGARLPPRRLKSA